MSDATLITWIGLCLVLAALPLRAADVPPGGTDVFGSDLATFADVRSELGGIEPVALEGPGFDRGFRITVQRRSNEWALVATLMVDRPIRKGEVFLVRFHARAAESKHESGQGLLGVPLKMVDSPWTKLAGGDVTLTNQWSEFNLPGRAEQDYPAGSVALQIHTGQVEQVVEIGGLQVLSFGSDYDLAKLPRTKLSYHGRAPDAPWRSAARQRIAEHRTADLAVQVIGRDGRPIPGARVQVELVRHAFDFGIALHAIELVDESRDSYRGRREGLIRLFNAATFANDLKWEAVAGDWGENFRSEIVRGGLQWLKDRDLSFRGHVMLWPGRVKDWGNLPTHVRSMQDNPDRDAIRRLLLSRIDEVALQTRGLVDEWDVVNEPFDNHALIDLLGEDVLVEWFKRAKERLPEARLTINDYAILTTMVDGAKHDSYEQRIRRMQAAGAPVDVVGLQGHFGQHLPSPERMLRVLDRFGALAPIRITEYDLPGSVDADVTADFTRDVVTLLYSHPRVIGFQTWWDLPKWVNADGSLTPIGQALDRLVNDEWRTRGEGVTDAAGTYRLRGHLGHYRVRVEHEGRTKELPLTLAKQTSPLIVTLP
jgi:GH35 family endo-1,4-beta-xylanase